MGEHPVHFPGINFRIRRPWFRAHLITSPWGAPENHGLRIWKPTTIWLFRHRSWQILARRRCWWPPFSCSSFLTPPSKFCLRKKHVYEASFPCFPTAISPPVTSQARSLRIKDLKTLESSAASVKFEMRLAKILSVTYGSYLGSKALTLGIVLHGMTKTLCSINSIKQS